LAGSNCCKAGLKEVSYNGSMLPSGKWIDGIDADGSVDDAARRSLRVRLTAMAHWLPLAAHLADHDVEHVHRLRVATRRAIAALKLYRDRLPGKRARWVKKRLKKIRRAAGDARDLDVLGARLSREYGERATPVIDIVAARRAEVQSSIVEIAERCGRGDRLIRKTGKLLAGVKLRQHDGFAPANFREWAAARLADSVKTFFDGLPGDAADTAALHQFRIRGKQLRYTIELVVAAFGPELRNEYYLVVEELQERLGDIQDRVTAIARLCEWANVGGSSETQVLLRELAEEERENLIDAVGDFQSWWTVERAEALLSGLTHLTGAHTTKESPHVAQQM
jgi:CHAD domain-containing protein